VLADLASVRYGDGVVLVRVEKGILYLLRDPKGDPITPSRLFEELPNSIRLLEGAQASEPIGDLKRQLEPPVPSPSKIIGIGKNFREHAIEMRSEAKPVYFMKAPSALVGHLHVIEVPAFVQKPDYEGEVVIVIGRKVKLAGVKEARESILGFMAGNDVTARDLQYDVCMPWCLSKSLDTFSPTGPYLRLISDYSELEDLCLETYLNGERVQRGCAGDMSLSFAEIVADLSRYMTLLPGDLIFTGTPPGVGHPRGRYLRDGDLLEVAVSGLDRLVNPVKRVSLRP